MTGTAFDFQQNSQVEISLPGIALVVFFHAVALWLLMSLDIVPAPVQLKPLMVQIIPPRVPEMGSESAPAETPAPPIKPPEPPKVLKPPRPVKKIPRPAPPTPKAPEREMLVAQAEPTVAPSENAVAAPPPEPPAPVETEGGAGAGRGGAGPGGSGGPGTQPRFDADYLHNPRPVYPPMSRRMGEEGKVYLRVRVEPDGRPSQVEIKTSSGSVRLNQAAEDAVRRWRFIPAKRGDEAVSAWVVVPISFNLKQ